MIPKKVCTDLLEDELKNPILNAKRSYRVIERLAVCVVSLARDVTEINKHLHGNGTPGGITAEIEALKFSLEQVQVDLSDLKNLWVEEYKSEKRNRRESDKKSKQTDSFDALVKWIVDKVLPAVIIAIVFGISYLVMFGAALRNGWIKFP